MKFIVAVLLVVLGMLALANAHAYYGPCHGQKDGNYPDPHNCNGYIACSGGVASKMDCPSYLTFYPDSYGGVCDYGDCGAQAYY